jgi:hypothetical protein
MNSTRIVVLSILCSTFAFAGYAGYSEVPEPSTWLMIGTAGLGLLALKKFRKK